MAGQRSKKLSEAQRASIGAQVRRARKSRINEETGRAWNSQHLADVAGVAQGTVLSIENGEPVRPGNLRAVLDALDLAVPPPGKSEPEQDRAIALAQDLVKKWLLALPEDQRDAAVGELTRFCLLTER